MSQAAAAALVGALVASAPLGREPARAPRPGRAGVRFTDVAPRSSFAYRSNNDSPAAKYFPQPMCGGVADPRLRRRRHARHLLHERREAARSSEGPDASFWSCLLRDKGDGTLRGRDRRRPASPGENLDFSFGVAAGDFDNDGYTDLFVCQAGPNALYRNNGDGTFTDVTARLGPRQEAEGPALGVRGVASTTTTTAGSTSWCSQYTYWNPETDQRCVGPGGAETYCFPAPYKSVPNSLYRNLGDGRFEDVSVASGFAAAAGKGMGIAIADFDGNGLTDVFVANDTEPNFLYLNQGDGSFKEESWAWSIAYNEQGAIVSGMGADAKDYDNDGWPDVFYNNLKAQIWALFQNRAPGSFRYASPRTGHRETVSRRFSGWSTQFVDYDNDGWKDIYSANGDVDYLGPGRRAARHDVPQPRRPAVRGRLRQPRARLHA